MSLSRYDYTLIALRALMGAWFAYSGAVKIFGSGLEAFAGDVANYRILLDPWNLVLGWFLAWLEVVAGLAVLVGVCRRGGLWAMLGMTGLFVFGIGQGWVRGLDISCGCFGTGGDKVNYPLHISALLVQGGLVLWLLVAGQHRSLAEQEEAADAPE